MNVESLWRYCTTGVQVRWLVLDEIESILTQFNSSTIKLVHKAEILDIMQFLLANSQNVIAMDANFYETGDTFLDLYRRPHCETGYTLMKNDYPIYENNNVRKKFLLIDDSYLELVMLVDQLKRGDNVAYLTDSLKRAKIVKDYVLTELAELEEEMVFLLSSETKKCEKSRIFSNIDLLGSYRFLLCTPTLGGGPSFGLVHYHTIFANFRGTADVFQTIQSLFRIRFQKKREEPTFNYVLNIAHENNEFDTGLLEEEEIEKDLMASLRTDCVEFEDLAKNVSIRRGHETGDRYPVNDINYHLYIGQKKKERLTRGNMFNEIYFNQTKLGNEFYKHEWYGYGRKRKKDEVPAEVWKMRRIVRKKLNNVSDKRQRALVSEYRNTKLMFDNMRDYHHIKECQNLMDFSKDELMSFEKTKKYLLHGFGQEKQLSDPEIKKYIIDGKILQLAERRAAYESIDQWIRYLSKKD